MRSPGRPEFCQYRSGIGGDKAVEDAAGQLLGPGVHGGQFGAALAAMPLFTFLVHGNAVAGAAGRTDDDVRCHDMPSSVSSSLQD